MRIVILIALVLFPAFVGLGIVAFLSGLIFTGLYSVGLGTSSLGLSLIMRKDRLIMWRELFFRN